ncbi:MAG: ATP-binding cassette domain-containing protein [Puniceicoccales bacterium]|jgi:phospholipid/cholesterol/gamma-HCH transport system ATP-binding protein|nr:ATP-binding cassette domain-containing protein [Puniceicoccales bacterium]
MNDFAEIDCVAVAINGLQLTRGPRMLISDITIGIPPGEIFAIIGGSGCGKSTLLKHLIGIQEAPPKKIMLNGHDMNMADSRGQALEQLGVLFQSGALWSSMTILENVAMLLEKDGHLTDGEVRAIANLKLDLVGLGDFGTYYPHELSGGMVKRAGIARALARNPSILFLDEPSAGLDPVSSRELDQLILQMRENYSMTIVMVTHELRSIYAIVDRVAYLDAESHSLLQMGDPRQLANCSPFEKIRNFFAHEGSH